MVCVEARPPARATPRRGRRAVFVAETPDEVARPGVADALRDLGDGEIGVGEQPARLPHPALGDPLLHGPASPASRASGSRGNAAKAAVSAASASAAGRP